MNLLAAALILAAAAWRIVAAHLPGFANVSPLMALAFCGGAYFRDRRMWLVPFLALVASDLYLDRYYSTAMHYDFPLGGALVRILCFACGLWIGRLVSARRAPASMLGGISGASLLFYAATNTVSWAGDAGYRHDLAGWWQAMTVGHPQFPPTILFYRNTFASDLVFTGLFAAAMALGRRRVPAYR
jgi:hypothetical protein